MCPVEPLLIYNNFPPKLFIAELKSKYFLGNNSLISSDVIFFLLSFSLWLKLRIDSTIVLSVTNSSIFFNRSFTKLYFLL